MNTPSVVKNLCKSCGFCVRFCPKQVIRIGSTRNAKGHFYPEIDMAGCIGCGTCAVVCPEAAIEMLKGEG